MSGEGVRPSGTCLPWLAVAVFLNGVAPAPVAGQDGANSLTEWLNGTIDRILATRLEQTSGSNQIESPSVLGSSTTLVDHASASDLIGLALNPVTFPRSDRDDAEKTSQTFTISPYAILTALTGRDPDDPWFYQEQDAWRLLTVSIGTEQVDVVDQAGTDDRAMVVGLKLKIWDRRNVDPDDERLRELGGMLLPRAGAAYGRILSAVQDALTAVNVTNPTPAARVDFLNRLDEPAGFHAIMGDLSAAQRDDLIATVERNIEPFLALRQESAEVVTQMRGAPQLSLGFTARMSQQGRDAYRIGIALDRDLAPGVAWTLNGGIEVQEALGALEEDYGATLATELAFDIGGESLTEDRGARLALAAQASLGADAEDQVRVQAKLVLPLAAGLELPISLTWATRTDLVDESDVFGQIGFTMDTASLMRAIGR